MANLINDLSGYLAYALHRGKADPDLGDENGNDSLSEFLESAINQARPKPIGNVKECERDRRAYWLDAMGTLERPQSEDEQEDIPRILHASAASYIEPTLEQATAILKAFAIPTRF